MGQASGGEDTHPVQNVSPPSVLLAGGLQKPKRNSRDSRFGPAGHVGPLASHNTYLWRAYYVPGLSRPRVTHVKSSWSLRSAGRRQAKKPINIWGCNMSDDIRANQENPAGERTGTDIRAILINVTEGLSGKDP